MLSKTIGHFSKLASLWIMMLACGPYHPTTNIGTFHQRRLFRKTIVILFL
jgi:hypothetical protein